MLHLSSEGNFIPCFVGCPRTFAYAQTGYWAWPFLTPFVPMGLDIGSGLLQCSLNAGLNWPPQYLFASWASCGAELSLDGEPWSCGVVCKTETPWPFGL